MRTEIVVPFAIDTTPIEKRLQEHADEEVSKILREMVERCARETLPKRALYGSGDNTDWRKYFDWHMTEWLNEHAEEIIDEAAMLLAMRGTRRTRWRDVLAEYKSERGDAKDGQDCD